MKDQEIHERLRQSLIAKANRRISAFNFLLDLDEIQSRNQDLNFEKEPLTKLSKGLQNDKPGSNPYTLLQSKDLKSLMKALSQEVNQLRLQICDSPEYSVRNPSKTYSLLALERFQHLTEMLLNISLALQHKARHTDQCK